MEGARDIVKTDRPSLDDVFPINRSLEGIHLVLNVKSATRPDRDKQATSGTC